MSYVPPPSLLMPYAGARAMMSAIEKPSAAVPFSDCWICTNAPQLTLEGLTFDLGLEAGVSF
jgi:hypothetical protein